MCLLWFHVLCIYIFCLCVVPFCIFLPLMLRPSRLTCPGLLPLGRPSPSVGRHHIGLCLPNSGSAISSASPGPELASRDMSSTDSPPEADYDFKLPLRPIDIVTPGSYRPALVSASVRWSCHIMIFDQVILYRDTLPYYWRSCYMLYAIWYLIK